MTAFDDAVAECRAQKLGMSACLDHIDPFCDGNPEAIADGKGGVIFRCANPLNARKAAILLAEAEKRQPPNLTPWLILGGVLVAGVVVYGITR